MTKKKVDRGIFVGEREDLGPALHTALRKYCDSTPTSIAWNAINLLDKEVWCKYLDAVWQRLTKGDRKFATEGQIAYAGMKASCEDWDIVGNSAGVILKCSFKQFGRSDWMGYAALLYDTFPSG